MRNKKIKEFFKTASLIIAETEKLLLKIASLVATIHYLLEMFK
ncbi:hypothetical protein [Peptacetobacter sp.]|nr:hypothetical protein [Peptacetobacter sp.]